MFFHGSGESLLPVFPKRFYKLSVEFPGRHLSAMLSSQGWILPQNAGIGLSFTATIKQRNYLKEKSMYSRIFLEHMEESSKGISFDQNKMKQGSRHQSSTTAEPDHQTFTYSFTARTITVGPFCTSHFQTHVTSLGCFMYSGKKQRSANACFQIYIWAARSHLDRTQAWGALVSGV